MIKGMEMMGDRVMVGKLAVYLALHTDTWTSLPIRPAVIVSAHSHKMILLMKQTPMNDAAAIGNAITGCRP